jgi:foldase protein PrsA
VKCHRQGSQEGIRKNQDRAVPEAGEFEKFLRPRARRLGPAAAREAEHAVLKNPAEDRKGKGKVTQAQIAKYYNEHKSQFGTPEKRNVEIVLTKTEAASKSAKKEVESGKSFASVAKSKSIDPTSKANGGLLKGVVKGEEEKALDTAIFSAKQERAERSGEDPVRLLHLRGEEHHGRHQQTLAQSQTSIKQQLTATQQQSALSKFVKEFKKKWTGQNGMPLGLRGDGLQVSTKRPRRAPPRSRRRARRRTTTAPATK